MLLLLGHWRTSSRSSPATEDNRIEVRLKKRLRPPRRKASEIILARTDQSSARMGVAGRSRRRSPKHLSVQYLASLSDVFTPLGINRLGRHPSFQSRRIR